MFRLAATGDDGVIHGLAGNGFMTGKLAAGEIAGWQAAGLIDNIDQNVGAILAQGLGEWIVDQGLGKDPGSGSEAFGISNGDFLVGRF